MKKTTIILITFVLNLTLCIGQEAPPREGAIKTENGVLVYYNYQNPFTISLKGDVDLSKRTINIDGNLFEFTYGVSKQFGETEKEILSNYMKWELDYL